MSLPDMNDEGGDEEVQPPAQGGATGSAAGYAMPDTSDDEEHGDPCNKQTSSAHC